MKSKSRQNGSTYHKQHEKDFQGCDPRYSARGVALQLMGLVVSLKYSNAFVHGRSVSDSNQNTGNTGPGRTLTINPPVTTERTTPRSQHYQPGLEAPFRRRVIMNSIFGLRGTFLTLNISTIARNNRRSLLNCRETSRHALIPESERCRLIWLWHYSFVVICGHCWRELL